MRLKTKDLGHWGRIVSLFDPEETQGERRAAEERLVGHLFVECRYGGVGVRYLDSVDRDPPDIVITEHSGEILGLELARVVSLDFDADWAAPSNNWSFSQWEEVVQKLHAKKEGGVERWSVNVDRRGLLLYSSCKSLMRVVSQYTKETLLTNTLFDETWFLADWVPEPKGPGRVQPALFDLKAGTLIP